MIRRLSAVAPADTESELGLPEEEPRRDRLAELRVYERVDQLDEQRFIKRPSRNEIHLGPGFQRTTPNPRRDVVGN